MPYLNFHSNSGYPGGLRWLGNPGGKLLCVCGLILVAGNFARVPAQTRPEAPPFDAASHDAANCLRRASQFVLGGFSIRNGDESCKPGHRVQGDRITDVGPADRERFQLARVIDLVMRPYCPAHRSPRAPDAEPGAERRPRPHRWTALRFGRFVRRIHNAPGYEFPLPTPPSNCATPSTRDKSLGPRLQVTGPGLTPRGATYYAAPSEVGVFGQGPGMPVWQNVQDVNSPWLARAAVREHSHYGTDWIKNLRDGRL